VYLSISFLVRAVSKEGSLFSLVEVAGVSPASKVASPGVLHA